MRRLALLLVALLALGGQSALGAGGVTVSPGDLHLGQVAVGDSATQSETITNSSGGDVTIAVGTTNNAAFSIVNDNCSGTLTNGQSCGFGVRFSPGSQGSDSGTLSVDEGSVGSDTFSLSGTGTDPIDVQPASLDFGSQSVGTNSSAQPVSVANTSGHQVDLNTQLSNGTDYSISGCGGVGQNPLSAGGSCIISVVFSPNSAGQQTGKLTVAGHDVALSGTGTTNTIGVSPGSMAFGNQPIFTATPARTVTVTNTGSELLNLTQPTLGGTNPLEFAMSDNCTAASPLSPGGQCTITIAFAPTITGNVGATLQVHSDATGGTSSVDLTGTGTPSAVVFTPGPLPFNRPHHAGTFSTPRTITLTNRTSGPLTISRVRLDGQNPGSFRILEGTCAGATIAADQSCTETVRFAPNKVGAKSATLTVSDDGPNSPHSVALTGRATYPKDDAAVRGAVGCDASRITWRRGGSSSRFYRTVIVRSRRHIPAGPNDGTRLPHGVGVLHDVGLRHFTAYEYRVFAVYRSHTKPGTFNHSRGVILRLRTGQICTPMNGAVITDTTPTATWLRHPTLFGYSFRLFHAGEQVQEKRSLHARSFTFRGRRRLRHGFTYTLFLYAYPPSQPDGKAIGRTTFRVR